MSEMPLVCNLDAMTPAQRTRHQALAELLKLQIGNAHEDPDGWRWQYDYSPETCLHIAEFITLERLCCPFLHFKLEVSPQGVLSLYFGGSTEIKEFARLEMGG
jgi:hypothetical protein